MFVSEERQHETFIQLFLRHERAIRAYARTLLPTWESVDEVMQETSLVAWRKFDEFEVGTNFGAWLGAIVRYEALRWRRSKQRDRHVFCDEVIALLESEGLEDIDYLERQRAALQRCIGRLGETHQRLLAMVYGSEMAIREVADKMSRSIDALYKSLQRLRAALLKCAQEEMAKEASQ